MLETADLTRLPAYFLAHAPRLHTLVLETEALHYLPPDLMAHAPQLRTLWLTQTEQEVSRSGQYRNRDTAERRKQPLPTGFLVDVPNLRYLRLHLPFGEHLPQGFLNHAPQLRNLVVAAERLTRLPSGCLAHAPQLQCLTLPAHLRSPSWAQIPACPEPAPLFGMDRPRPGYVPSMG